MAIADDELQPCAIGVRPKTGSAVLVVVAAGRQAPHAALRDRAVLATEASERFLFHHAAELPLSDAAAHVEGLRATFAAKAEAALGRLAGACEDMGLCVAVLGVAARRAKPSPPLAEVVRSHALIHAAEGDFYAGVWRAAIDRLGLPGVRFSEAEALEALARASAGDENDVAATVREMGRPLGPPWAADERAAALAAWAAMASR
jgi:hypothetical protein